MNATLGLSQNSDGSARMTIISPKTEEEEEPPLEQLPSDFMTITANDFGIVDGNDYWGISTKNLAVLKYSNVFATFTST